MANRIQDIINGLKDIGDNPDIKSIQKIEELINQLIDIKYDMEQSLRRQSISGRISSVIDELQYVKEEITK